MGNKISNGPTGLLGRHPQGHQRSLVQQYNWILRHLRASSHKARKGLYVTLGQWCHLTLNHHCPCVTSKPFRAIWDDARRGLSIQLYRCTNERWCPCGHRPRRPIGPFGSLFPIIYHVRTSVWLAAIENFSRGTLFGFWVLCCSWNFFTE